MKAYVTIKMVVHDVDYEHWTNTEVDAVFSSQEKALNRIKYLAEKESDKWAIPETDENEEEYSIEGRIDSEKPNTYRVWMTDEDYALYAIVETDFDP